MLSQTGKIKMQDAAVAIGNGSELNIAGRSSVVVDVSGITNATVTFEISFDNTNWSLLAMRDLASTTDAKVTSTTADGEWIADKVAGMTAIRARISAWVAGTITVIGNASD